MLRLCNFTIFNYNTPSSVFLLWNVLQGSFPKNTWDFLEGELANNYETSISILHKNLTERRDIVRGGLYKIKNKIKGSTMKLLKLVERSTTDKRKKFKKLKVLNILCNLVLLCIEFNLFNWNTKKREKTRQLLMLPRKDEKRSREQTRASTEIIRATAPQKVSNRNDFIGLTVWEMFSRKTLRDTLKALNEGLVFRVGRIKIKKWIVVSFVNEWRQFENVFSCSWNFLKSSAKLKALNKKTLTIREIRSGLKC